MQPELSRARVGAPRRIATISVHTSPLDQPGTGDAGGLNVYVVEVARQLARRGIEVEIFTRAVCRDTPPVLELAPGVLVRNLVAGPFEELDKNSLPGQICPFTFGVLRTEADFAPGRYDLVHAHYWLSGQVGAVAAERWGVPLVQSMHTLGKVKNLALARGDCAEPAVRIRGEGEVVAAADRLVANTEDEARQLIELYGATPWRVETVSPGVDLSVFRPSASVADVRRRLGLAPDAIVLVFAGRIQPLKGPDVVLRAAASLLRLAPELAERLVVVFVGGPSGSEVGAPGRLDGLAGELGVAGRVRFEPPCPHRDLADWYRAATLVLVPSHSESFGLVALEAQACGTPVAAAAVGGLRTAVRDGFSGVLVDGHDPEVWASVLRDLVVSPRWLASLSRGALAHASGFGWPATADRLIEVYTRAMASAGSVGAAGAGRGAGVKRAGEVGGESPAAGVEAALRSLELGFEQPRPGAFLVKLEGQHKLATMTWLVVGEHSLGVEAFFCRQPDENHEAFYRFLLERNGRMYGVHFTLDQTGDVYLTGRLPLSSVSADDIDRLLGCVLSYSDENFDAALELGFGSAIRREWAWRVKRGESLANLQAFARFADPDRGPE